MPHFTNAPPPNDPELAFRIVRTPAKAILEAIVTAGDVVGTRTHFVHNRTVPCEKPRPCPFCQDGVSYRWHGYLSAILCNSYEHILFEFTKVAAQTFKNYLTVNHSLRACKFKASRPRGHHNSRVLIVCKLLDERHLRLPEPPDIARILCHIWNVPYSKTEKCPDADRLGAHIGVLPGDGDGRYRPSTSTDT